MASSNPQHECLRAKKICKVSRKGRDPFMWILKNYFSGWQKWHFTFLEEKVNQCISGAVVGNGSSLCPAGALWCHGEHWHKGLHAARQCCPYGMVPLHLPSGPLQLQRIICLIVLTCKLKACSQRNKALQNVLCSLHNCSSMLIIYDNISECTNCMQQTL